MTCFPGDIVSLEEQLCQQQYNATPLDSTRDFYSFTHTHKSHSRKAKKKDAAIKKWPVLTSCPLQNVFKKAKWSA